MEAEQDVIIPESPEVNDGQERSLNDTRFKRVKHILHHINIFLCQTEISKLLYAVEHFDFLHCAVFCL